MGTYTGLRHDKWAYRRSKVGERLRKYLIITPFPSLECYTIYGGPAYNFPTAQKACFVRLIKITMDCNASMSKVRISVEWEFAEVTTKVRFILQNRPYDECTTEYPFQGLYSFDCV
ncbi:hypothetical protein BD770DRAFT_399245 [Pilaira anomala]|nr:hypothetical protein BD770DRAFT_399245 [Pilaira anomala]